jgi:polar amino acid transport system substrate-binding protein
VPFRARHRHWAVLLLLVGLGFSPAVRAEGVLERVARSGRLQLVGPADRPPLVSLDAQGQPHGFAVVVAERVVARLSRALGRPVSLQFQAVRDGVELDQRLSSGRAELACGLPFTWARDMVLDYSLPIAVSGLRLLAPEGRFVGDSPALSGRSIGVVTGSLAESSLRGMQPAARVVTFPGLQQALDALNGGRVDGVLGDSLVLKGLASQRGLSGLALTPEVPFERYGLVCAMPENASAFRNLVNRAIVELQQDYLDGDPATVTLVDRWLGPGSAVNFSPSNIRRVFEALLLGTEALRPLPARSGTP